MNFSELQKILLSAIASSRTRDAESLSQKSMKLPLSDAFFCGEDTFKNQKFYEAIEKALWDIRAKYPNEKIRVIDAGSGTWVLGVCALIAWADYVTFIEANPHTLSWSQKFVEKIWYGDRSEFYCEDATKVFLPEKYHLLLSETITIDFGREDFHHIISHLKQFLYRESIIIPEAFEIEFHQKTRWGDVIQHQKISRKSLDAIWQHIELVRNETHVLEISGRVQIYKDVYIKSGDVMSFFNTKSFDRKEIEDTFIWAK